MDVKTIAMSLFSLLLVLTIFSIFINYTNIVIYTDKLQPVREDVFVVVDQTIGEISLAKYIVYEVNLHDYYLCKPLLLINHELSSFIIEEIGISNVFLDIGFSNSTPVIIPKAIINSEEYEVLVRKRYSLEQVRISIENTSIRTSFKYSKYLLITIRYIVDKDKYIDFSKYLPPIIYYPRRLVLNTTFTELINYSSSDTHYLSILTYSINTMLNEYSFIKVLVEYIASLKEFNYGFLVLSWIILFILIEFEKPKITLYYSRKLFYKLLVSLNYMLRKLRELKQRVQELGRV